MYIFTLVEYHRDGHGSGRPAVRVRSDSRQIWRVKSGRNY